VSTPDLSGPATVARLMREIEDEVRELRRSRLVARGGPDDYEDEALFAIVERVLRRAVEERDGNALLIPELLDREPDWDLRLPLQFSSHRGAAGAFIVFVKRRVLLPLMYWLYHYSRENFRRQQRVNRALFAAIEELAIENARLRLQLGLDERADGDGRG
jgi:plasmid stabilization system protein ParE